MAKHAVLSASSSHRWLMCTPSARLEEQIPNTTSKYAEEGTKAHEAAEFFAKCALGQEAVTPDLLHKTAEQKGWDLEMVEAAEDYAVLIEGKFKEARERSSDAFVDLEATLSFEEYVPEGFGTGDCVIIADGLLEVIDFKYGKGVRVEAEDNSQMQLYALGALAKYSALYDINEVRLTIFQPRLFPSVSETVILVESLYDWGKFVVKPQAKKAFDGEGDFFPSEEACRFCRAGAYCEARAKKNLGDFDDVPEASLLSLEDASEYLKKAKDLTNWINALEARIFSELLAGSKADGWKIVEGRSNRKFADETKVVAAMEQAGIDKALLYEKKLLTLTQFERDFGKKQIAEILGDLIVKPAGSPTLVPSTDKRPEYQPDEQLIKEFDKE